MDKSKHAAALAAMTDLGDDEKLEVLVLQLTHEDLVNLMSTRTRRVSK
jgi:hypothetical protein